MPTNVLLLGASGIPGRYILSSLLSLTQRGADLNITVLKRSSNASTPVSAAYSTTYLEDFSDTAAFATVLASLKPDIVISALNAEPAPKLDNLVVDAILHRQAANTAVNTSGHGTLYINGYTLDLLHPSVASLPDHAQQTIKPKVKFAQRLDDLARESKLEYCTIVNAAFLDYCLVKGYSAVNLADGNATLIDSGEAKVTGCSLDFVGDAVALAVQSWVSGAEGRQKVRNVRLRIAETTYSAQGLVQVVQRLTGREFGVKHERAEDVLANGAVVRYLNWAGQGAADFSEDGFDFGRGVLKRKTLEELCNDALRKGVQVFDGIGR